MKTITLKLLIISLVSSLYAAEIKVYKTSELPRSKKTGIVYDPNTNLMWQDHWDIIKKGNGKTWKKALNHCKNSTYAGYTDWSLPSPKQLLSIIDHSKKNPATKKGFRNIGVYELWSKNVYLLDRKKAWAVNLYHGYRKDEKITEKNQVSCVRRNKK